MSLTIHDPQDRTVATVEWRFKDVWLILSDEHNVKVMRPEQARDLAAALLHMAERAEASES